MILALLLSLATPAPPLQADDARDPPVSIRLNHEEFLRGARARVFVETARDGHVVVLHADPDGRVRVLFPLDPGDDDFVRGGKRVEIRGRGDRDAFLVYAEDGSGTVLAALSPDPFRYEPFVRGDHWDYRVLGVTRLADDPLAGLLDIVSRMAGEGGEGEGGARFDYDAATYVVGARVASGYGYVGPSLHVGYGYPYGFGLGVFYGYPYRYRYSYYPFYDAFYDPFCYDPFWGWGAFCPRYGFLYSTGSFYRPYGYGRAFIGGRFFHGPASVRPPLVIPRDRVPVTPVEPRRRSVDGWTATAAEGRVPAGRSRPLVDERSGGPRGLEPRTRAVVPRERGGSGEPRGGVAVPRGREGPRASPEGRGGRTAPRGGREFRPSNGGGRRPAISRGSSGMSRGSPGGSRPVSRPGGTRRRP